MAQCLILLTAEIPGEILLMRIKYERRRIVFYSSVSLISDSCVKKVGSLQLLRSLHKYYS